MREKDFVSHLNDHKIALSSFQLRQFHEYYQTLVSENEKYNLTAITQEEEVYEKHFYDSLSLLFTFPLTSHKVLDVGAGAGFPSLPLKIVAPSLQLFVLDATAKKVAFISQLSQQLQLNDVTPIVGRVEEYRQQQFDVVVARGVAPLAILLELVCHLVKPNGYFVAYKGAQYQKELEASQHACQVLGFELVQQQVYTLPSEQAQRCNLFFKKVKDNARIYPRAYAKIKQKPL